MKSWGWLAAVVLLVGVVFGITFMSNYDPEMGKVVQRTTKSAANVNPEETSLEPEFATKVFPPGDTDSLLQEYYKPGHHDYWMTNPHPTAIKFGLEGKKCTCTSVFYFKVPLDHAWWQGDGKGFLKNGKPDMTLLQEAQGGPKFAELEKTLKQIELTDKQSMVEMAPGEVGLVRMTWKNEKLQKDVMTATMWMGKPELRQYVRVEARINTAPLLMISDSAIDLGVLNSTGKPSAERQISVISPTRSNLEVADLNVRLTSARSVGKECVVVKEVRKASEAQLKQKQLESENPIRTLFFVTIGATWTPVSGGEPEIGPLVRRLEVSLKKTDVPEQARDALPVRIGCRVEGDIEVLGTDERGYLLLHRFERQDGSRAMVQLEARDAGLSLEVDRENSAPFVQVELDKRPKPFGDKFRWDLRAVVLPGKVSGEFPRSEGVYKDCAIFVKIGGEKPRTIRIPITGRADN